MCRWIQITSPLLHVCLTFPVWDQRLSRSWGSTACCCLHPGAAQSLAWRWHPNEGRLSPCVDAVSQSELSEMGGGEGAGGSAVTPGLDSPPEEWPLTGFIANGWLSSLHHTVTVRTVVSP